MAGPSEAWRRASPGGEGAPVAEWPKAEVAAPPGGVGDPAAAVAAEAEVDGVTRP